MFGGSYKLRCRLSGKVKRSSQLVCQNILEICPDLQSLLFFGEDWSCGHRQDRDDSYTVDTKIVAAILSMCTMIMNKERDKPASVFEARRSGRLAHLERSCCCGRSGFSD